MTLIAAGVGFGFIRGLRVLDAPAGSSTDSLVAKARIDALDLAVAKLGERIEVAETRVDRTVTRDELNQTLDRVFGRLEADVNARFERHHRSVEALRLMVGQTDELLQKVLDGLESFR